MKIGLYSRLGRQDVVAARELIAAHQWPATLEGIREARQAILDLPEGHPALPVVWSPDFYSVSGTRDLLFHVCEHRYDLPRLGAEMSSLNLEFLGFQHFLPSAARHYRDRFPGDTEQRDLTRWQAIEEEYPETFAGMFQFWCRKP